MEAYKWIWNYIKKYVPSLSGGLGISLVAVVLSLVNPYLIGKIVQEVFQNGEKEKLLRYITIMILVNITKSTLEYTRRIMFETSSQKLLFDLRKDVYARVQEQNFKYFDKNKVGDIMSRMTGDLEAIRHFVAGVILETFQSVLVFILALSMMFYISWELSLLMLIVAPVIYVCTYKQSKEIKPYFHLLREQFSKLNSVTQENISGNRVVKAFTQEDYEIDKFKEVNQGYWDKNVDTALVWVKYFPILELCAGGLYFILILGGGLLVIYDKLELWQVVTINSYLWAISNPMRTMGNIINDIQRFIASTDKVFEMMHVKVKIKTPEDSFAPDKIKGDIEFKNVSFGFNEYDKENLVLKNINFSAKAGQTIGIVGRTGSGKTTLINLISRYYDVLEGSVLVDGVDVKKYDLQKLRKGIAAANQDVFLFSDTVEGNIAYGVVDATMESIFSVAEVADAHNFILKLEDGYDTIIGERGVGLSGGQRQRLSLARALEVSPSILILDDTTSAVDMETEHEIQRKLNEKYSDRTKIIIAHRISSVKSSDLILVLDNGEIIESGTHNELVSKKGNYYELFTEQYGDFVKGAE